MSKNATKVQIESSDGVIIKGTLVSPQNASDYILMLHGITVDRNEYLGFFADAANDLAHHGIGSLRIDFRGHGKSTVPQREFTIRSQIEDTGAALKWLRSEYPTATLSILGTSFGAPPAIFAASKDPTIKRLLLVAPVLDYRRTFLEPETDWAAQSFDAHSIQEAEKKGFLLLDDSFEVDIKLINEMRKIHPLDAIASVQAEIFAIHGDQDSMVPHSISAEAASTYQSFHLLTINGMDHGYIAVNDEGGVSPQSRKNKQTIFEHLVRCIKS